jgi:hypothetical protein
MDSTRLELIEQQLDEREDDGMAMWFAFIALARALDEAGTLPLASLTEHLTRTADQLRAESGAGPRDLAPVAAQVDSLRDALARP